MAAPKVVRAQTMQRVAGQKMPALSAIPDHKHERHERAQNKPLQNPQCFDEPLREDPKPMSGAFRQVVNSLNGMNSMMLSEFQMKLLRQTTAALADTLVGPNAPSSLRLLARRALRAAVLAAYAAAHFARIWTLVGAVAHPAVDSTQVIITNVVELVCILSGLLSSGVIPSSLLLRIVASASAVASGGLSLDAVAESMSQHQDSQLPEDLGARMEEVMNLATSSAGFLESGREVVHVARELLAVRPQVRSRSTSGSAGGKGDDDDNGNEH